MKRVLLVLLFASVAWGDDRKLSPELKGRHSGDSIDVIVQFKVTPAQKHKDSISLHGGSVKQHLGPVKGFLVSVPASRVAQLSNDPDVVYISPDRPLTSKLNNAAAGVLANYAWSLGWDGA